MTHTARLRTLVLIWVLTCPAIALADSPATDPMRAPSNEELDRRVDDYIGRRRWMAGLIVGGTLLAGTAGSVLRRRQRRAARALGPDNSPSGGSHPEDPQP